MITLLAETTAGGTPTPADLATWASTYNITHPVVADPNWGVTNSYTAGSVALPSMHQLGVGAVVLQRQTEVDASEIEPELPIPYVP